MGSWLAPAQGPQGRPAVTGRGAPRPRPRMLARTVAPVLSVHPSRLRMTRLPCLSASTPGWARSLRDGSLSSTSSGSTDSQSGGRLLPNKSLQRMRLTPHPLNDRTVRQTSLGTVGCRFGNARRPVGLAGTAARGGTVRPRNGLVVCRCVSRRAPASSHKLRGSSAPAAVFGAGRCAFVVCAAGQAPDASAPLPVGVCSGLGPKSPRRLPLQRVVRPHRLSTWWYAAA
jgi:hypothetical protein